MRSNHTRNTLMTKLARLMFLFLLLSAPLAVLSGCAEKKVTTVTERETVRESPPEMQSPGEEVVE